MKLKARMDKKTIQSQKELQEYCRHQELHPTKTRDSQDRLIFDAYEASKKLKELVDMESKVHRTITPATLHATCLEFQAFMLDEFRPRIYQEERCKRFETYLNQKRKEKEKQKQTKKRKKSATAAATSNKKQK